MGSVLRGQNLNKESVLLTDYQLPLSEENLDDQNKVDELISHSNSDEEKLKIVLQISEDYLRRGFLKESLKYIFQAEQLSKESRSKNLKAYTYILLASFYRNLELNKKAAENLDKVMDPLSLIKEEKEKNYIEGKFQLEKGLLNFSLSNDKEALIHLWKSKSKFWKIGDEELAKYSLQTIYNRLGNYYLTKTKSEDSSVYYFQNGIKLAERFPSNINLQITARNGMIKYYLQKKQYDSALYFTSSFYDLLPKVKDARLKKDAYKNLAHVYYATNNADNYKLYNQSYLKLNDSIYESDKETRILLAKQLDSAGSAETQSNLFIWIIVLMAVSLAVLGITYGYHLKVKKEYAQFQKIMQGINEREKLSLGESQISGTGTSYIISEKTEQVILDKLKKFEDSEKYISPKVSLQYLAKQLDTNTKYLSEIINKNKGQNFNNYINELRIHYLLRKLKSEPKYQNYKVSSLAEECGFGSRNTFTMAFKNTLGMSPAKFIGFIRKENYTEKS